MPDSDKNKDAPGASVRSYLSRIGRKGGRIGGRKRAEVLSPERLKEIAAQGAKARVQKAKEKLLAEAEPKTTRR